MSDFAQTNCEHTPAMPPCAPRRAEMLPEDPTPTQPGWKIHSTCAPGDQESPGQDHFPGQWCRPSAARRSRSRSTAPRTILIGKAIARIAATIRQQHQGNVVILKERGRLTHQIIFHRAEEPARRKCGRLKTQSYPAGKSRIGRAQLASAANEHCRQKQSRQLGRLDFLWRPTGLRLPLAVCQGRFAAYSQIGRVQ